MLEKAFHSFIFLSYLLVEEEQAVKWQEDEQQKEEEAKILDDLPLVKMEQPQNYIFGILSIYS